MQDRRRVVRQRSYLGGHISFNGRACSMDCIVRSIGPSGAGVAISDSVLLPAIVDFEVPHRGLATRARVAWRTPNALGLEFAPSVDRNGAGPAEIVPIAIARRVRTLEAENIALRERVARLAGEE